MFAIAAKPTYMEMSARAERAKHLNRLASSFAPKRPGTEDALLQSARIQSVALTTVEGGF